MNNDIDRTLAENGREPSHNGTHEARPHDVDRGAQAVGRSKFDLGSVATELPSEDIPWGYGETRVTAMARDPDWLYAYWELTDNALSDAARRLGPTAQHARCCLRVYDTTDRVFDGTNANSYFDIAIERTSRDWFLHVGRPASSCHVEVGLKDGHGAFQPIARSGRTEFPRKRPVQNEAVEWLTVEDSGPFADPPPVTIPYVSNYDGPEPELPTRVETILTPPRQTRRSEPFRVAVEQRVERHETWRSTWTERRAYAWSTRVSQNYEGAYHRVAIPWLSEHWRTEWQGGEQAFAWISPLHRLTWAHLTHVENWELAPYPGDGAAPGRVVVRYTGDTQVIRETGMTTTVFGPWEVTIHGPSFDSTQRRVLGAWVMYFAQPTTPVRLQWAMTAERVWFDGFTREGVFLGASEGQFWLERGASETWVIGGSEEIWLGASELLQLGGSEELLVGASEQTLAGVGAQVEQWSLERQGASEMAFEAASEILTLGASERWSVGASESWIVGASEQAFRNEQERFAEVSSEMLIRDVYVGASEQVGEVSSVTIGEFIGASESLGASEHWGVSEQIVNYPGASELLAQPASDFQLEAPLGGASEHVPGLTGPRPQGYIDNVDFAQDAQWNAVGASEEVVKATYPRSLDPSLDPNDSSDEGAS